MKIPVQAQVIKKLYDNSFDDLRIKYGLTMNEIMFLLYLDKNKANNTASEIVENLVTTKSHISKSIDSLAKGNIIIRIQDELDKKIIRLYISDTANDLLDDLRKEGFIRVRIDGQDYDLQEEINQTVILGEQNIGIGNIVIIHTELAAMQFEVIKE